MLIQNHHTCIFNYQEILSYNIVCIFFKIQVKIVCSDIASLHYAIATVFQLFSLYKDEEIHVPPLLVSRKRQITMMHVN